MEPFATPAATPNRKVEAFKKRAPGLFQPSSGGAATKPEAPQPEVDLGRILTQQPRAKPTEPETETRAGAGIGGGIGIGGPDGDSSRGALIRTNL